MQTESVSGSNGKSEQLGKGHRVLFVSNRSDKFLKAALQKELGFKTIKWCIASPRSLESAAKSVKAGAYSLVLLQTGFLDHSAGDVINKAARAAGITYINVDKGRPAQVKSALRQHNVLPVQEPDPKQGRINWSGAELHLVEAMALEGHTDAEIASAILYQYGISRDKNTVGIARREYFGVARGEKKYSPKKNLPESYFDIAQAKRLAVEENSEQTTEVVTQPERLEVSELVDYSKAKGSLTLTISGPRGECVVETHRSPEEVFAFLMGY